MCRLRSRIALMTVFGSVIDPRAGFDEDVPDISQFGNLSFGRLIATQLVSHNLARRLYTRSRHAYEEPFGCIHVAALQQQDIELGTVLIDCPSQQVRLTAERNEHFVKVTCRAWFAPSCFDRLSQTGAELPAAAL